MFEGFREIKADVGNAIIHARVGGDGAPVLLLHGDPQTHVMWHQIAETLAETYQIVAADLRGYGDSVAKDGDFSFRAMALDMVKLMASLGHSSFHVVSHDRGARTAHRMALDHPEAVKSIVLMDIIPTLDVWRTMDDWLAKRYYHWTFLAQPGGMPERLINGDPVMFMRSALIGLSGSDVFSVEAMAEYERAACNPDVIAAWCGDYAAGARIDLDHDRASLGETRDMPCLILWGSKGAVDHHLNPVEAWTSWFPHATGQVIDAGHFLVEERPKEVLKAVQDHLRTLT